MTSVEVPIPASKPALPLPAPLNLSQVDWIVITPETIPTGDYVLFALSKDDFERLTRNMADIERWVIEAMWQIQHYRSE